jgi:hypothetical protein
MDHGMLQGLDPADFVGHRVNAMLQELDPADFNGHHMNAILQRLDPDDYNTIIFDRDMAI